MAACAANFGIAIAKLVGYGITGASSMLAEAVHSFADTGNQALLLLGGARARRKADERRPFGYGRERYFWAFVVALVIFALGSVFALVEGYEKFRHPHELESPLVAVVILSIGLVLESGSFWLAVREAKKLRGNRSWWHFIKTTRQAELPVVLLEDLGALIGLLVALAGVGLSMWTGDPRFDGASSMVIGVLLGVIAVVLALEMHSLLIGEAASPEQYQELEAALLSTPRVSRLVHMRTTHLGPDQLLVGAKVEFSETLSAKELTEAIDAAELCMRTAVPSATVIYIEPDFFDPSHPGSKAADEQPSSPAIATSS